MSGVLELEQTEVVQVVSALAERTAIFLAASRHALVRVRKPGELVPVPLDRGIWLARKHAQNVDGL